MLLQIFPVSDSERILEIG